MITKTKNQINKRYIFEKRELKEYYRNKTIDLYNLET